jgi:hypothetical protein
VPPAAAPGAQPGEALRWKLHLHRAQCSLIGAEAPQRGGSARSQDEGKDLESCGAPLVAGEPPAPRMQVVAAATASGEEPARPAEGKERESERAPVRLHVQAVPADGVRVWLGIDGDAALVAQRASVAVADLRRNLQSGGERIASIVCNGVALDPRAPSSPPPRARTPSSFPKDSP